MLAGLGVLATLQKDLGSLNTVSKVVRSSFTVRGSADDANIDAYVSTWHGPHHAIHRLDV